MCHVLAGLLRAAGQLVRGVGKQLSHVLRWSGHLVRSRCRARKADRIAIHGEHDNAHARAIYSGDERRAC